MGEARIALRITDDEKRQWEDASKTQGLTITDLIKTAVEILSGLDPLALSLLGEMRRRTRLPLSVLISNLVICWAARDDAQKAVDENPGDPLFEFMGPFREDFGKWLFEHVKQDEVTRLRERKRVYSRFRELSKSSR